MFSEKKKKKFPDLHLKMAGALLIYIAVEMTHCLFLISYLVGDIVWSRKWQPTPVFLPGEPQGWWGLVGCRVWGRTESNTTEAT